MKKRLCFILIGLLLLLGTSCGRQQSYVTNEQWINEKINFVEKNVIGTKDITIRSDTDLTYLQSYSFTWSGNHRLEIGFIADEFSNKNTLYYHANYYYSNDEMPNLSVVLPIVNTFAYKSYSKQFCESFLQAPEEKYSIEKRGSLKSNDYDIAKYRNLDFFEEHGVVEYYQFGQKAYGHKKGDQLLVFGGLTAK
ncbi:MAG: hypothetical protein IJ051_04115 [Clostridia bacterium]|nr:hypothetical protein [Clostridia bacterium]